MIIFPAIDIKDGRCIRLKQGRKDDQTVYGDNPAEVARSWAAAGARFIHVVDLDGAFSGSAGNVQSVSRILDAVDVPVQLGGGVRSMADIDRLLNLGVTRVIIGTAAVEAPEFVPAAVEKWGSEAVVVGIDARDGEVAVKGWEEGSSVSAQDLAVRVKADGVNHVVYTDISRDGMMTGPNVRATIDLARVSGLSVIASGGVAGMEDIAEVFSAESKGVEGVIVGKALYENAIDLAQAISLYS